MSVKSSINLLQPELLPEKHLLTLPNVVGAWVLTALVMFGLSIYTGWQHQDAKAQKDSLTQQKRENAMKTETLQTQLDNHKVSPNLVAKREQLKSVLNNKSGLLSQLTNNNKAEVAGFAQAMTELAELHSNDISIQRALLANGQITFQGLAKTPDAVPAWLSGFEQSKLLSGKHFNHFVLSENEDKYTEFSVSSDVNYEALQSGSGDAQ